MSPSSSRLKISVYADNDEPQGGERCSQLTKTVYSHMRAPEIRGEVNCIEVAWSRHVRRDVDRAIRMSLVERNRRSRWT